MANTFEFINHSPATDPFGDKANRTRIRRQAMRAAGIARKKRGNYGKHNLLQYPIFINSLPYFPNWDSYSKHTLTKSSWITSIPASPSSNGFELVRIKYGVDILSLSGLTAIHVGRAAACMLSSHQSLLVGLLQCKQWSYFSYVPSRYGHSPCLDDAIHCVAAKLQQMLLPSCQFSTSAVLSLYGKALGSLQAALDHPTLRLEADVLCATEILAMFEFLSFSGGHTWKHHMSGAARLIELRGPQSYATDFEKSLFMAFIGLIFTESLLNNSSCFLEQPSWQRILPSMITTSDSPFSDRSPIVLSFWSRVMASASYFKDVTDLIYSQFSPSQPSPSQSELISRGLCRRESFFQWRQEFNALVKGIPYSRCPHAQKQYTKLSQVLGVYLSCLALLSRLIGAVSSSLRSELEDESQALAMEVARMEKEASSKSPMAGFFLAQKMTIARSITDTADMWKDSLGIGCGNEEPGVGEAVIERWKFERWCTAMARTIPEARYAEFV
ncbi:hypothetical protein K432DRAFT_448397 [Lepidopterella palustris CBS 459.81]|uniref:Uncharacterized protein n=1 Tax=Lepidopterella palustris CBS 459.81 TaxID=1314670 RepID=A0A8E2EL27_9PEZI|nr:hypothetical protein K432DRAFT_448397 [Lepidopterella palustris CBS 459.81]